MKGMLRRLHPRRSWSAVVVVAVLAATLFYVLQSDGNVVPEPDLHDAGIWVTNESSKRVGRTNTEIEVVDTALDAQTSPFDVLQQGPVVVLHQKGPSRLSGIDPATSEVIPGPEIPDDAQVGLGGGTAALFAPGSGELFIAAAPNSSAALALDPAVEEGAVFAVDGPGHLAVGVDGLVHLLATETGEITTLTVDGEVVATRSVGDEGLDAATVTAVGAMPIVATATEVRIPGRDPVDVTGVGDAVAVQEPGPQASAVLVAADGGFARVPMRGGAPQMIDGAGSGVPARPVFVAGCGYGAWGGDLAYAQLCEGAAPRMGQIPELESSDRLRFRVNRERVTLNNLDNGKQLLFGEDDPVFIDNLWAEALTDEVDDEPEVDETADVQVDPVCAPENTDPVAEPDDGLFGTRADIPVVVYPLHNDSDPDCDVLLITSATPTDPDAGTVGIVESGRAVQVELAGGVTSMRFDYTISDGRGGEASSYATVDVVPENQNSPPVLSNDEETTVVTGGTVTHNVLAPAYDPDGDVLRLASATIEDEATGTVRFTDKGDITFTATNTVGVTEITYVVGDGEAEATGVLRVKVVDRNTNQPPNARKDSATTFAGREVVLDVLDNDTDPDGDTLSLVRVSADGDAAVSWDPTSPEIRVVADRAGTINVTYRITDGQATDETVFRVDVRDEIENLPPVAVRDEVLLTPGIPAYVPVVDNDVDPDGSVLVVLGIDGLPEPSPISVTVLQRSVLKITTATPLADSLTFEYRISDGANEAIGRVLVEPAEPNAENRPPVAAPDEFTVRAGGIATLPVLANDSDPDADPISVVAPPDEQPDAASKGRLFLASDGQLRFEAPTTPRASIRHIYSVEDTAANVSSAEVVITVLAPDADVNEAPTAPELIGRTVAGQQVTISVPITTMDPDGDAVTFLGLGEAPQLGTVVEIRPDELVYLPDEDAAGTDEFTYRVVDSFGQEATGTVVVGVAGRSMVNNRPIPVDDAVSVRPGATVRVPVLGNDSDPDGDPVSISTAEEDLPVVGQGTVAVDDTEVVYTAPDEPDGEETSFRYVASDGRGLTRSATVVVTFRDDDNNQPPEATDDTTTPQVPESVVSLDLLSNDEDPDQDELTIVEVSRPEVVIAPDGRSVEVTMPATPLQFTYLVSDGEATSRAAVFVPVADPESNLAPIARLDDDIEVDLGESVTIPVLDNDEDPEGEDLHLLQLLQPVRHGAVDFQGNDVVFTATEENYAGDAGFYYLVGDTDDPATAKTAVGAVRIRVTGEVNTPPEFVQLAVEVPAGSERQVDLDGGVVDPDLDDDHDFSDLSVDGDGVDVDLDGDGSMVVSAPSDTPPGTSARTTFTVADEYDEVTGSVVVTVVSSDRPLAVVGPDDAETVQGVPVTVDVLANDTNPFPDTPLEIISLGTPTGGGLVSRDGNGGITFDPGDWFGTATVTYTVADETGDPAREVEGTLTVNVIGFPDAPPAPTCIGGESRVVRVQWAAPSANGSPITEYVVRVSGDGSGAGDRTVPNASTVDIDGLTNGVDYTFEVGAVNRATEEAGVEPQFSPPSPPCTPDQVPGQPEAPVTQYGDQEMAITWTAPTNEGSAIQGYTLANASNGESKQFGPSETSHTWTGLENGTCYRFTLTATNDLGDSDPSPQSSGDQETCVPAGVPQNPSTPTITNNEPGQRSDAINVAWTWDNSTQGNGDDVSAFLITPYRNGTRLASKAIQDGTARSTVFSVGDEDHGSEYTFTLTAVNKAGESEESAHSAVIVPADVPDAPPTPGVAPEPGAQQVTLTFSDPDDNGASITAYQYSTDGGSSFASLGSNKVVSGLSNGSTYRLSVRARNSEGWGPWSSRSGAVVPFGKPNYPTGFSGNNNGNTLRWSWNALGSNRLNGHDHVVRYQVRVRNNGTWSSWSGNGTSTSYRIENVPDGECRRLRVRAIGDRRGEGSSDFRHRGVRNPNSVRVCAPDPPSPTLTIFPTGAVSCDTSGGDCTEYNVSGSNFPANTSITHYCQFRNPGDSSYGGNQYPHTVNTDGNGNFTGDGSCHVGTNTYLRYHVTWNGNSKNTCGRTKDQGSCST